MRGNIRLTKKKECTVLTWQGKLLVFIFLTGIAYCTIVFFPLFLSKSKPVHGKYLVLDGQMPDYSIEKAIELVSSFGYDTVITTGSALSAGYYIAGKTSMAELSLATFLTLGFDSTRIIAIPGGVVLKDRTFTSGLSLKKYFDDHGISSASIDILAVGCHARRSRTLFQKALGKEFEVGVYAINDNTYNIKRWWKTSKGFRTVISETIAYFYVLLFFNP